ncbi:MAG: hypothetical protein AABY87_02390 [bacterium]
MFYLCLSCEYFSNDPRRLEQEIPGLNILSSAYASVRGEAGICRRYDLFLDPREKCPEYQAQI